MANFPKNKRVRDRRDFRQVMDNGEKIVARDLVLFMKPSAPLVASASQVSNSTVPAPAQTRIGFVVSRKVGNAVARNRIKRHLRESFRSMPERLSSADRPMDIVVVARGSAAERTGEVLGTGLLVTIERGLSRVRHSGPFPARVVAEIGLR